MRISLKEEGGCGMRSSILILVSVIAIGILLCAPAAALEKVTTVTTHTIAWQPMYVPAPISGLETDTIEQWLDDGYAVKMKRTQVFEGMNEDGYSLSYEREEMWNWQNDPENTVYSYSDSGWITEPDGYKYKIHGRNHIVDGVMIFEWVKYPDAESYEKQSSKEKNAGKNQVTGEMTVEETPVVEDPVDETPVVEDAAGENIPDEDQQG
jgi:hypothetical protein